MTQYEKESLALQKEQFIQQQKIQQDQFLLLQRQQVSNGGELNSAEFRKAVSEFVKENNYRFVMNLDF